MPKRKKRIARKKSNFISLQLFVGVFFVFFLPVISYILGTKNIFSNIFSSSVKPSPSPALVLKETILTPTPTLTFIPTLIPTLIPENKEDLKTTVKKYYQYISNRQIKSAYDLFSQNYKKSAGDYTYFLLGFSTTSQVNLTSVEADKNPSRNLVKVTFTATDTSEGKTFTRNFSGSWQLIKENNEWKLDSSDIQQI